MYKTEDILNAAKAIQPEIKNLLGDESDAFENDLTGLLEQSDRGEDVEIELIDLLSGNEKTREWMAEALKDKRLPDGEKSYTPLPGINPEASKDLKNRKFVCPEPGCDHFDFMLRAGQKPDPCPIHCKDLKPEQSNP